MNESGLKFTMKRKRCMRGIKEVYLAALNSASSCSCRNFKPRKPVLIFLSLGSKWEPTKLLINTSTMESTSVRCDCSGLVSSSFSKNRTLFLIEAYMHHPLFFSLFYRSLTSNFQYFLL